MTEFLAWLRELTQSLVDSLRGIGEYLPFLLAALLLMALGWLVARIFRAALIRLGTSLNAFLERFGRPAGARNVRLSRKLVGLIGNVVFWVIILLFAAMATRVARLEAFSGWLDRVVAYLPTLVAGGLIVLTGYLLSKLIRDVVSAAMVSAGSMQNELVGFAAQSAVFLTAVVIGLDQIGIDVTFLIILLAVLVGGTLLSLALAFGFGAGNFVGNLIAAQQVQRILERGQLARIGEIEGRVLEFTPTSIVLLTESGRVIVPAKRFQEETAVIVADDEDE